jgi:hypothetical protein
MIIETTATNGAFSVVVTLVAVELPALALPRNKLSIGGFDFP